MSKVTEEGTLSAEVRVAVAGGALLIEFALALSLIFVKNLTAGDKIYIAAGMIFVALGCIAIIRLKSRIEVQDKSVLIALSGLIRRNIPFSSIELAEVTKLSAARAGGVGLRWLGNGTIAILTTSGEVLSLKLRDRDRTYLISTRRREDLLSQLEHGGVATRY